MKWQPTPIFLPAELHGQRSLVGYTVHGVRRVGHDWATNTLSISLIVIHLFGFFISSWFSTGRLHVWRNLCISSRLPNLFIVIFYEGFPDSSVGKEPACNAGDPGSISESGRSTGEGIGYPLKYSGLENSMDCVVHGVTKSRTRLSNFYFRFQSFMILSASVVSVVMFPLSFLILFSFLFFSPLVQLKTCQYNLLFKKKNNSVFDLFYSFSNLSFICFCSDLCYFLPFANFKFGLLPRPHPSSVRCEIRLSSQGHFTFFGHTTWRVES